MERSCRRDDHRQFGRVWAQGGRDIRTASATAWQQAPTIVATSRPRQSHLPGARRVRIDACSEVHDRAGHLRFRHLTRTVCRSTAMERGLDGSMRQSCAETPYGSPTTPLRKSFGSLSPAELREAAIRRDEPVQHRNNQLARLDRWLSVLATHGIAVCDEIPTQPSASGGQRSRHCPPPRRQARTGSRPKVARGPDPAGPGPRETAAGRRASPGRARGRERRVTGRRRASSLARLGSAKARPWPSLPSLNKDDDAASRGTRHGERARPVEADKFGDHAIIASVVLQPRVARDLERQGDRQSH